LILDAIELRHTRGVVVEGNDAWAALRAPRGASRTDLRPGGRWRASSVGGDGNTFSVEGEFLEIDPPRSLVQTWRAAWDGGNETLITYRLEAIDGGTRVTVRHEGFAERADSCRGHGAGWQKVLGPPSSRATS